MYIVEMRMKVPDYFFYALSDELIAVFDDNEITEMQLSGLYPDMRFLGAFYAACCKVDMIWLFSYCISKDEKDSDALMKEIAKRTIDLLRCDQYDKYEEARKKYQDRIIKLACNCSEALRN